MASLFGGNAAGFGYGAAPGRDVEQVGVSPRYKFTTRKRISIAGDDSRLPILSFNTPGVLSLYSCVWKLYVQLFDAEMPLSSGPAGGGGATATPPFPITNTLDEPIWDTMKRDLVRIGRNLVMVVFPFKDRSQQSAALRNWVRFTW
jgi:hypothetical protein